MQDHTQATEDRNEVKEVEKSTSKETTQIRVWRFAVTVALLLTGVAVTFTSFKFLSGDQEKTFKTAYAQFSRTVADAAIQQQKSLRETYRSFADTVTAVSVSQGSPWPLFTLPLFESIAANVLIQSGTEVFAVANVVLDEEREDWVAYANATYEQQTQEGHILKHGNLERQNPAGYNPFVSQIGPEGFIPEVSRDRYYPVWTHSPPPFRYDVINWNLGSFSDFPDILEALTMLKNESLASRVQPYASSTAFSEEEHAAMHSGNSQIEHPHSLIFHPIHRDVNDYQSPIVAVTAAGLAWDASLRNLLPDSVTGIIAEIRNSCGQEYTYEIEGKSAIFVGEGNYHEVRFDSMEVVVDLSLHTHSQFKSTPGHCQYRMHIFPSTKFESGYKSNLPVVFSATVAVTFALIAGFFFSYDLMVARRNKKLVFNAARSNAIVSSVFPFQVRDRLMSANRKDGHHKVNNLEGILDQGMLQADNDTTSKPLADLFLETSVMFADIVGFTAWSSIREPTQVFVLLETLYAKFDEMAKHHGVFKVETVGDCYVAVTGLPRPVKDHTLIMAEFARDLLFTMSVMTERLEATLGPDTGDLTLRIGIHSGPVTAGVLRGERARFQLFGDTMNTTARIESTGEPGRVHVSQEAAYHLFLANKGSWLVKREGAVALKGKGSMETYWMNYDTPESNSHFCQAGTFFSKEDISAVEDNSIKNGRLIDWTVDTLYPLLEQVVMYRQAQKLNVNDAQDPWPIVPLVHGSSSYLDEVRELITLPAFDKDTAALANQMVSPDISGNVKEQLRMFVAVIAGLYNDNQFHNFEHASHVLMSVNKLLSRIVAPSESEISSQFPSEEGYTLSSLHDHTYGITSDPLTQFACAFAALIHDVDHSGVPNAQLIKEKHPVATCYRDRSVAEQNSVDIAWVTLGEARFKELQQAIFYTQEEYLRFRQLVVNMVMATDIADQSLKKLRDKRWQKAFHGVETEESARDKVNRKATIVIEHLIQASDVCHTMQHWHVYRKWNERLFMETYDAYLVGRGGKDPSIDWYKGELSFFDFYVIPLTSKLRDCGVFGKSSGEYLDYALRNRKEWEEKGETVVADMVAHARSRNDMSL